MISFLKLRLNQKTKTTPVSGRTDVGQAACLPVMRHCGDLFRRGNDRGDVCDAAPTSGRTDSSLLEWLRSSSSRPLMSQSVMLNGVFRRHDRSLMNCPVYCFFSAVFHNRDHALRSLFLLLNSPGMTWAKAKAATLVDSICNAVIFF